MSDVESYRSWFQKLDHLLWGARMLAVGLAVLVVFCVVAVIGNTIRLAVARRRQEIEVMKLCGATNGFVRGPFVLTRRTPRTLAPHGRRSVAGSCWHSGWWSAQELWVDICRERGGFPGSAGW